MPGSLQAPGAGAAGAQRSPNVRDGAAPIMAGCSEVRREDTGSRLGRSLTESRCSTRGSLGSHCRISRHRGRSGGRTQPGRRGEAGLFPARSATPWASRQKPRTLAAGVPLTSLGTSRRFCQCSSGPHIYLAAILEPSSSWPGAPSSLQPGGAVPTQQRRRQQWSQQGLRKALHARARQGQGPAARLPWASQA